MSDIDCVIGDNTQRPLLAGDILVVFISNTNLAFRIERDDCCFEFTLPDSMYTSPITLNDPRNLTGVLRLIAAASGKKLKMVGLSSEEHRYLAVE